MRRRFPAAAFIAAAPFALVGSSAFAHDMNQSAVQRTTEMGTPPRADVKPFEQAKVSLIQAVTDAQKRLGGHPLDARFEVWHGQPTYLIRTYTPSNEVSQERVNADTGDAIGQATSMSQDRLGPELRKDIAAMANMRTDLTRAINNAESEDDAKAIMARAYARHDGSVAYKVDLVKHGRLHVATVDGKTGQLG